MFEQTVPKNIDTVTLIGDHFEKYFSQFLIYAVLINNCISRIERYNKIKEVNLKITKPMEYTF